MWNIYEERLEMFMSDKVKIGSIENYSFQIMDSNIVIDLPPGDLQYIQQHFTFEDLDFENLKKGIVLVKKEDNIVYCSCNNCKVCKFYDNCSTCVMKKLI
jgi:hypothetical protein